MLLLTLALPFFLPLRDLSSSELAPLQKKDTSVTFWAEQNFFYHSYDTSMMIIVTKPGITIDVVAPTSMTKNHDRKWAFHPGRAGDAPV